MKHALAILLSLVVLWGQGVSLLAVSAQPTTSDCPCGVAQKCCIGKSDSSNPTSVPALPADASHQADWHLLPFASLLSLQAPVFEDDLEPPATISVTASATPLYARYCALLL